MLTKFKNWRGFAMTLPAALTLTVLSVFTNSARADLIDKEMMQSAAKVVQELAARKCKNVGVFRFQVQSAGADPTFLAGRLNSVMTARLENALILAVDRDNPIGVTRGASEEAAMRDRAASYRSADGRKKLFAESYPRAWGDENVRIDAIATGLVKLSPDLTQTTVELHLYSPGQERPTVAAQFTVPTNRLLLADMNQNFMVRKRELNTLIPLDQIDTNAIGGVQTADPKSKVTDDFAGILEFEAFYDGKKAQRGPDGSLETPREDQKIHFTLKSKERLGVVLLVNGINTLNEEADEREADQYSVWVLEPGKEYTVRGYYSPEKGKMREFRVLSESESALAELENPKRGKIELLVFREILKPSPGKQPPEQLPGAVLRPLNLRDAPTGKTLDEVRGSIRRTSTARRVRGLVAPDTKGSAGPEVQKVTFDGALAGFRSMTYYQPKR